VNIVSQYFIIFTLNLYGKYLRYRKLLSHPISSTRPERCAVISNLRTKPRRAPVLYKNINLVLLNNFQFSINVHIACYWIPPYTPRTPVAVATVAATTISSAAVGTWSAWAICHNPGARKRSIIVLLRYFYYFKTVWISIRGEGVWWCTAERYGDRNLQINVRDGPGKHTGAWYRYRWCTYSMCVCVWRKIKLYIIGIVVIVVVVTVKCI